MAVNHRALVARLQVAQSKDLLRRGFRVQSRARVLLTGGAGHPRRVDTGQLRSSVGLRPVRHRGSPAVRVGSGLRYARWVHDGTGMFGPRRRKITPKTKKALAFRSRRSPGKTVVVRSVRGMRPNAFLRDALVAARRV